MVFFPFRFPALPLSSVWESFPRPRPNPGVAQGDLPCFVTESSFLASAAARLGDFGFSPGPGSAVWFGVSVGVFRLSSEEWDAKTPMWIEESTSRSFTASVSLRPDPGV